MLFLFYPMLVKFCFSMLKCVLVGEKRYLMADLEEAPLEAPIATECSSVLVSVGTAAAAGERAPTPTFDV